MPEFPRIARRLPALLPVLLLTACGGSGGGTTAPAGADPPTEISASPPAGPEPAAPQAYESCGIAGFAGDMLAAVNEARRTARLCGNVFYAAAAPLAWDDRLARAAAEHSRDMADHDFFSHTGSDGSTLSTRIEAAGYRPMAWAENIAAGYGDVGSVMAAWLASPGHCANVMNPAYADFGAACAVNGASTYKRYWTQDFAAPR